MLAPALTLALAAEITVESLKDGPGILPFNLGPTRIVSHFHSFVQVINLENVRDRLNSVKQQLQDLIPRLNKSLSIYEPHVKYLENKLDDISEQLGTFEFKRVKRGLIDGLGSIIKSISGNLDYTDALKYDNAIAVLNKYQNNLAAEINHQISLSKQWVSHNANVTDRIVKNQLKIEEAIKSIFDNNARLESDMAQYVHLSQLFLILGDNIDNLSDEFSKLQNLLAFIRAKSNHHSVLNYNTFLSMKKRLDILYQPDQILDISFREYFDIIKIGYYYKDNEIILIFKFPIVRPTNYILYKLCLVPNRDGKILTPIYPFVAMHEKGLLYIETECPKFSHGHLCEDNISYHHFEQSDCILSLILKQKILESCKFASVTLSSEAMEQLDDQQYVMSFPNETKVRLICFQDQYRMLHGSYFITIPKGCTLHAPAFSATNQHDQIRGNILKIVDIACMKEHYSKPQVKTIKLNSIDLESLHSSNSKIALQEPVNVNTNEVEVLYHTTIPMYVILFGASGLAVTILMLRCRRNRDKNGSRNVSKEVVPECSTEMTDRACGESRDPCSLSALFSTNVSK